MDRGIVKSQYRQRLPKCRACHFLVGDKMTVQIFEQGEFKLTGGRKARKPIIWVKNQEDCYICVSHKVNSQGYATTSFKGESTQLHRLVYEELKGEIPPGFHIRHTCDNRLCINPEHMLTGTATDNMRDMLERHGANNVKLTPTQAREARNSLKSTKELAKEFNVTWMCIHNIRKRRTWKNLKD